MEEEFSLAQFMDSRKTPSMTPSKKKKKPLISGLQNATPNVIGQISDSLERYLTRSFEKCNSKKERKEMKKSILRIISIFKQQNEDINSKNWDEIPVPMLQREESQMQNQGDCQFLDVNLRKKILSLVVNKVKEEIAQGIMDNNITQEDEEQQQQQEEGLDDLQDSNQKTQIIGEEQSSRYQGYGDDEDEEEAKEFVVGVSTALEKDYLRLTRRAREEEVRSKEALEKSFKYISGKYARGEQTYEYFQSQFRAIRQDLNVQGIRGRLAISVFEHNARVCLENQDLREYKRCLGQLVQLYKEEGDQEKLSEGYREFAYYRLIEAIFADKKDELLGYLQEMNKDQFLLSEEFQKAMKFHHAASIGNVYLFFKLVSQTQDHGKYIMRFFIKHWLAWGLRIILKAYGPQSTAVSIVGQILGLSDPKQTLGGLNCVYDASGEKIMIKETILALDSSQL